jgi:hypothetical protein
MSSSKKSRGMMSTRDQDRRSEFINISNPNPQVGRNRH